MNFRLFICLFVSICFSQQWTVLQPTFDPDGVYNLKEGVFIDEDHGWCIEWYSGRIWYTQNGGNHWVALNDSTRVRNKDLDFVDSMNGWFLGEKLENSNWVPILRKTQNGGSSWEEFEIPDSYSMNFINPDSGILSGISKMYYTVNGGQSLDTAQTNSQDGFYINSIFFFDEGNVWAVGPGGPSTDAGIILKSCDGGLNWSVNVTPTSIMGPSAVHFSSLDHGCVVGRGTYVMMTFDGGESWDNQYGHPISARDVYLMNEHIGWIVGADGGVMKTVDGGMSWGVLDFGITQDLNNISFSPNGLVGYIFGEDNTIIKYESTNSNGTASNLPNQLLLVQNHPNPFNPTTTIQYQLPHRSDVQIRIYDLLGKQVETLVSETQEAGYKSVQWDATNIPSGMYFYQVRAGEHVQTRKMVLLK